jgi:hypothetical protein
LRSTLAAALIALAFVAIAGCSERPAPPPEGWAQTVETFHDERDAGLGSETGWLTLVALTWLEEGDNVVGSAPDAEVRLPEGSSPERAGRFVLQDDTVRFVADEEAQVSINGEPARDAVLRPDTSGDPDRVRVGRVTMWVVERSGRLGIRAKDPGAETLRRFDGVERYEVDPRFRVEATWSPYREPKPVAVPTAIGTETEMTAAGELLFELDGKPARLIGFSEHGAENGLFVVFGDATNGSESYAAGRFLDVPPPTEQGTTIVDFNRAVLPPCAFTPFATCPHPPPSNRLAAPVRAGERMPRWNEEGGQETTGRGGVKPASRREVAPEA